MWIRLGHDKVAEADFWWWRGIGRAWEWIGEGRWICGACVGSDLDMWRGMDRREARMNGFLVFGGGFGAGGDGRFRGRWI